MWFDAVLSRSFSCILIRDIDLEFSCAFIVWLWYKENVDFIE
jgi:hypothetical protein